MEMLKHAHSGLRWVVLGLLIYAIFNALSKKGKGTFSVQDAKVNSFTTMFCHIQLLLGFALYFTSPKVVFSEAWMKNASQRFYGMEHLLLMLLAIVLITIGSAKAKRAANDEDKFKKTYLFFGLGLILILAGIPWPFREALGGGWF